jgi:L-rhamnonate dehydratase
LFCTALTVSYAIKLIQAVSQYNIHWVEEFLPPDDYEGYEAVKKAVGEKCLLTTGEHEYTRYGFRQLIQRRCVDILQPDVNWVGGLTEAKRITAMASAYDIPVIPHGSSVFSYHLQISQPNCPMAEFLIMSPEADKIVPLFGNLFQEEPLPKDGYIDLPDKPGWGVELNPDLKLHRPYKRPAGTTV